MLQLVQFSYTAYSIFKVIISSAWSSPNGRGNNIISDICYIVYLSIVAMVTAAMEVR